MDDYNFKKNLTRDLPDGEQDEKYYSLGRWVNSQRTKMKQNKLEKEKVERLDALGMIWDMKEYHFDKKIKKLKKFYDANGHYDLSNNKELRLWRNQVRSRGVSKSQYEKLIKIGFVDSKIKIKE